MTVLQTQTADQLDTNTVNAITAKSTQPLDLSVGSVLLAIVQAVSGIFLWLQGIILQVQGLTRASTSQGSDLDTWMADFNFPRLGAVYASGNVTFARATATQQAVVFVGATVQTSTGTSFIVGTDTTNPLYSSAYLGYVLPINTASATVPVTAAVAGTTGNVIAGSITVITSPIPGIDSVTNANEFTNGFNAELDSAYISRFQIYINSLSGGTNDAIISAVKAVQTGLFVQLVENTIYPNTPQLGAFFVIVDDGSGNPPASLLTAVQNAIDKARPTTSIFGVFGPTDLLVTAVGTITSLAGYVHSDVTTAVATALETYINTLDDGATLEFTGIFPVVRAVPGVDNAILSTFMINGAQLDIVPAPYQVIKCNGTPVIS